MEARLAAVGDLEALFLLNALFGNETTREAMRESLLDREREIACVAFVDSAAAGFAAGFVVRTLCHARPRVEIEALFVREEFRGRGAGEALLKCLESEAASRGIRNFHLNVRADNRAARALYQKCGTRTAPRCSLKRRSPEGRGLQGISVFGYSYRATGSCPRSTRSAPPISACISSSPGNT